MTAKNGLSQSDKLGNRGQTTFFQHELASGQQFGHRYFGDARQSECFGTTKSTKYAKRTAPARLRDFSRLSRVL
jgi:hypothetical protein